MKKNMAVLKAALMAAGLPALVLTFGLLAAGCSNPAGGGGFSGDAATPVLDVHPVGAKYGSTDTAADPLFVIANVTDGGTLTYRWYSNTEDETDGGTFINGETAATYTPDITTTGTVYYYVVVTNHNAAATGEKTMSAVSLTAKVEKVDVPVTHAAMPTISVQPQGGTYTVNETATLSVTANKADAGTLTYQWYSNTEDDTDGGTLINGAIQANYMPPTTAAGTFYYYVIVTNTNNNVDGMTERTKTSDAATIVVTGGGGGGGGGDLDPALVAKWHSTQEAADSGDSVAFEFMSDGSLTVAGQSPEMTITATTSDGILSMTYTAAGYTFDGGSLDYEFSGTNLKFSFIRTAGPIADILNSSQQFVNIIGDGYLHKSDPSNPFKGTWTGSGYTLTMTAAVWEIEGVGKGVYTRNGNTATLTQTFDWFGGITKWLPIYDDEEKTVSTATIFGNTMTGTYGGINITFTKEAGGSGDAVMPTISAQPEDAIYGAGATTALPLTVTAGVTDGGILSYQWYRNTENNVSGGSPIDGEITAAYTPPITTDGTVYYYVVVTNTNTAASGEQTKTTTSRAAKVEKKAEIVTNAAAPTITSHPESAEYQVGATTVTPLSVSATVMDGGIVSQQWYRNTANDTDGGTPIDGETLMNYTPPTTVAGTFYYYVIFTNTNNGVNGMKIAIATSDVAAVTVTGGGGGSNSFVGTWTGSGITLTATAALEWEVGGLSKGTYILNGSNMATFTPIDYWTGTTWEPVPLGTPSSTATVSGNTMYATFNSVNYTLTKNGVPPLPPVPPSVDGTWISTNTVTTYVGDSYFKIVTADGDFDQFIAPSPDATTWQEVVRGTYTGGESSIKVIITEANTIMFDGHDVWKPWDELGSTYQAYMGGLQTQTLIISGDQFSLNGLIFRLKKE